MSNLSLWEPVEYRPLGIALEAPKDRYLEEVCIEEAIHWSGCMSGHFALHEINNGFLSERTYRVHIRLEVFSKEEWQKYLRGDRTLLYQGRFGEYEHKFCPRYLHFRKDVMASDGRVLVVSSGGGLWSVQDEDAIRRIINSAHFINP